MTYDVKVDYYAILGITDEATRADIRDAWKSKIDSAIEEEEKDKINEAFDILYDDDTRRLYDRDRKKYLEREARRVVSEEEGEKTANKGRCVVKTIGISLLVAALVAGAGQMGWLMHEVKDLRGQQTAVVEVQDTRSSANETETQVILESETEVTTEAATQAPTEAPTQAPTQAPTEAPTQAPTVAPTEAPTENAINDIEIAQQNVETRVENVKAFGNALDDAQVTERAQRLYAYAESIGAVNINTSLPYSLDDFKNMVRYLNGAYVPTSEANAFAKEDDFLAFACIPLNDPRIVRGVSFANECPTDGSYIADPVYFTDILLMGDSYCYPYLLWLQDEFNIIITSDNAEVRRNETSKVMQSYADIIYGKGFKMMWEGKEITITDPDLSSRTRVNDGNIFRLYGLIIPIYSSDITQQEFTVDTVNGPTTISVNEVLEQLNVKCAADIAQDVQYTNEGRVELPINEGLDNLYDRIQTNTVTFATDNLYFGNTSYYEESQTLSLK